MARTEMPSVSKRQATSATRSRMPLISAMRVPLSPYFMLVLSSAGRQPDSQAYAMFTNTMRYGIAVLATAGLRLHRRIDVFLLHNRRRPTSMQDEQLNQLET